MLKRLLLPLLLLAAPALSPALAHDTWVETNTPLIRSGDAVYVDLKLGNHGNAHRDFKLASKLDPEGATLAVILPDGKAFDLKPGLADLGLAPKEGYWEAKFAPAKPGVHIVAHTLDKVVNHGKPTRSVKSAKTVFLVSKSLDRVASDTPGFDRVLGHALELVPVKSPVAPAGPGQPLEVMVLFRGKPLPDAVVSFVPSGETLKEGFDPRYECKTDAKGCARFTPKTGAHFLVVVHHDAPAESGEGYEATAYSATLSVRVPDACPCCGG